MKVVSGETQIDMSSFCPCGDEDRFPSRRIALDRGVCYATSGDARPYTGRLCPGRGHPRSHPSRRNFHLISIRSCHER